MKKTVIVVIYCDGFYSVISDRIFLWESKNRYAARKIKDFYHEKISQRNDYIITNIQIF